MEDDLCRNWPVPGKSYSVVSVRKSSSAFVTPVSHFDWTKPSQKSLSRSIWFYALLLRLYHYRFHKKACRSPPVYYTGSIDPRHQPKFEWPDNTFKIKTIKKEYFIIFMTYFLPEQLANARAQLPQLYGFSPATGES
jgi:hypothetical protein